MIEFKSIEKLGMDFEMKLSSGRTYLTRRAAIELRDKINQALQESKSEKKEP